MNAKFEIRNSKSETNSKLEYQKSFEFRVLNLFRISSFVFRI